MNSYHFTITQLVTEDRPGYDRVVTKIMYNMNVIDETGAIYTQLHDSVDVVPGDLSQRFIHFEQITKSEATIWLNAALSSQVIDAHRAKLDAEVERIRTALQANTTLVTHMPWDETVDGVATIPDQQLIPPGGDRLTPYLDTTPPGCYLLNPDGTLKILESIVDPTVE